MADGISGRLEMYLLTPVPESQNSNGYELFRLPVPRKQLDSYLKTLDPKAKIVPDLTTLQHKVVKIIKQHLQRENLWLGVVKLVEQRVYSANDANICPPVNIVYIVLRPTSKADDSVLEHRIETIPIENVANAKATLSMTYVQIVEILPTEENVEDLQAEADPQAGFTDQSIGPIVTHKTKQKRKKKGKSTKGSGLSDHHRALATVHEQNEDDDDDDDQILYKTQEGMLIPENYENSTASAEIGGSAENSAPESSTDSLSRFLASLRASSCTLGEVESTNSTAHSPTPPSDAPTAVMIPLTPGTSALAPSEPVSLESVAPGSPVKGHPDMLRHFATPHPPSKKILSRSSTPNPPIAIMTGSDASRTLVDSPRPLFSRETVSLQPPIDGSSTESTAALPADSPEGHQFLCSGCTQVVATGTTATSSISIPSTALASSSLVQQSSTAPAPSFAYSFDPQKFSFEFKHEKHKH